jgi:hypothetical protein
LGKINAIIGLPDVRQGDSKVEVSSEGFLPVGRSYMRDRRWASHYHRVSKVAPYRQQQYLGLVNDRILVSIQ